MLKNRKNVVGVAVALISLHLVACNNSKHKAVNVGVETADKTPSTDQLKTSKNKPAAQKTVIDMDSIEDVQALHADLLNQMYNLQIELDESLDEIVTSIDESPSQEANANRIAVAESLGDKINDLRTTLDFLTSKMSELSQREQRFIPNPDVRDMNSIEDVLELKVFLGAQLSSRLEELAATLGQLHNSLSESPVQEADPKVVSKAKKIGKQIQNLRVAIEGLSQREAELQQRTTQNPIHDSHQEIVKGLVVELEKAAQYLQDPEAVNAVNAAKNKIIDLLENATRYDVKFLKESVTIFNEVAPKLNRKKEEVKVQHFVKN